MTKLISQLNGGTTRQPTSGAKFEYEESGVSYPATLAEMASAVASAYRGCVAKLSTDKTALNFTTPAAISWDAEDIDTDNIHSTVTNPSRLTVPSGVTKIRLRAGIWTANVGTGNWLNLYFWKNGTTTGFFGGTLQTVVSSGITTPGANIHTPLLQVTSGDYFEAAIQIQTDTSIDLKSIISFFEMEIVG